MIHLIYTTLISYKRLLLSASIVAVALLFDGPSSGMLVPLIGFVGSCNGSCDGDDSCGFGSGSGSGTGNAGTGNTSYSTPFLCVWDGQKYKFENDFLFGKPTSVFLSKKVGKDAYENGRVGGDYYKIQTPLISEKGKIAFQIKEIEPEESFIDHLSLLRVRHPKGSELVVNSGLNDFSVFDRNDIELKKGLSEQKIYHRNLSDTISKVKISSTGSKKPITMETGESLNIYGQVKDNDTPLFLILTSHFRDWTIGRIEELERKKNTLKNRDNVLSPFLPSHFRMKVGQTLRSVMVLALISIYGALSFFSSKIGNQNTIDERHNDFTSSFGIKTAYASYASTDNNRSLVIEYWNGTRFIRIDTVSPRYYRPSSVSIKIPPKAIDEDGNVRLRIVSTKRHKVASAVLVAPQKQRSYTLETLRVSRAYHNRLKTDYADEMNNEKSGQYLHTVPADIVDIEFEDQEETKKMTNDNNGYVESYVLTAKGFYTPISEEGRQVIGNRWVEKLDTEAQKWLKEMYALQDYHKADRTTVL